MADMILFEPMCIHAIACDQPCADCVADLLLLGRVPKIYVTLEEWQAAVEERVDS